MPFDSTPRTFPSNRYTKAHVDNAFNVLTKRTGRTDLRLDHDSGGWRLEVVDLASNGTKLAHAPFANGHRCSTTEFYWLLSFLIDWESEERRASYALPDDRPVANLSIFYPSDSNAVHVSLVSNGTVPYAIVTDREHEDIAREDVIAWADDNGYRMD